MYKTELFNKISPNYPDVDNEFVISYYKKITEFLVDHHFSREELDDFRKLIESDNSLQTINYSTNVDIETINKINNIMDAHNKETVLESNIRQNLIKNISKKEIEALEIIGEANFIINNITSLKEIRDYSEEKNKIITFCKGYDFSKLESVAFVYGYIRDKYKIGDSQTKIMYEVFSKKEGSIDKINMILCDILQSLGVGVSFNNNDSKILIKFSDNENTYSLDLLTDMNIKNIIGTDSPYEAFMPELEIELRDKTMVYINKRLKEYDNESIAEEPNKEKIEEELEIPKKAYEIPMVSDNTMTFAIPITEIQSALENEKNSNIGVIQCKEFLKLNSINNNQDFNNFLINNGLSSNISNYLLENYDFYNILKSKESTKISITKYPNKISYYIPTTENDNHSLKITINKNGSLEVTSSEYSNFMESGIRYGSTNVSNYKENNDTILIEEKINRIRQVENITPEMVLPVYIVDALKIEKSFNNGNVTELSNTTESMICTIENGSLVPSNVDEQEKMYQIRELGFDEKYYTKKQIAGLNKYSDGREIYVNEENLNIVDEGGIVETDEMVLVKTTGKANILLITGIVGFVIGLGVGLAFLILNIS